VSDADLYAVSFAAELLCLRDQSFTLTLVLNKNELNDLLSMVLCGLLFSHLVIILHLVVVLSLRLLFCQCLYFLYE